MNEPCFSYLLISGTADPEGDTKNVENWITWENVPGYETARRLLHIDIDESSTMESCEMLMDELQSEIKRLQKHNCRRSKTWITQLKTKYDNVVGKCLKPAAYQKRYLASDTAEAIHYGIIKRQKR